jgi:arylsulfatase A-like enzyme
MRRPKLPRASEPGGALRALIAIAVTLAAIVGFVALEGSDDAKRTRTPDRSAAGSADRPNLLVVMTDDQTTASFGPLAMPFTSRLFRRGGTNFSQAIAAPPLCCPARAGFLTGRYAHNHGVVENIIGYPTMRGKRDTFPVALKRAGYETGLVGKFMNGYEPFAGPKPAPGFASWHAIFGYAGYTDFQVSDDGELRTVPGYATDVLAAAAIDFTATAAADQKPFFLWFSLNAPHTVGEGSPPPCDGADPQPPDAATYARFADEELPRPATFDEDDITDKRSLEDGPPPLSRRKLAQTTRAWRCTLAAVAGVDDGIRRLVNALRSQGQLENTVLVFLSDNGGYFGEHRLIDDKRLPLEPGLRIPMAVRVGSEVAGDSPGEVSELVSQVDLAPTLLDYAGVDRCAVDKRCVPMDGRSLRPLLDGTGDWPADRAIPLTLDEAWTYEALRAPSALYMELTATRYGEFEGAVPELYELDDDPNELEAITDPDDPRIAELSARLARLQRCRGIEGRDEPYRGAPFCE